jgi:hypothetical protein
VVELRSVFYEETLHTGELVSLGGKHDNVELDVSQVLAFELQGPKIVGILRVDHARKFVRNPLLKSLN